MRPKNETFGITNFGERKILTTPMSHRELLHAIKRKLLCLANAFYGGIYAPVRLGAHYVFTFSRAVFTGAGPHGP